ncbi:hypothetical protein GCM10011581_08270 [Saccharopolyspora subtropica]|uniref:Uncharacterized protein n=1 Tax=Saccharopolyspora thermophila TaxID=89367 RepID=A0A917N779_9PSEU|nr:hypothetical protein [Saccharopolyspora subtropica]GGI73607.1 hypothetical protein GCM10011581_08270 [Saccharopolyspora subtropica]
MTNENVVRRDVLAYGPDGSGAKKIQLTQIEWYFSGNEIHAWTSAEGPCPRVGGAGPDLFCALLGVRRQLAEADWLLLIKASRRDAWFSTKQYPARRAGVRLYPNLDGPPLDDLVDALAPEEDVTMLASWEEQMLWRKQWKHPESQAWTRVYGSPPTHRVTGQP